MTGGPAVARCDLLAAVLDTLVPADGAFPAAGAVAADYLVSSAARSPAAAAALSAALAAVDAAARAEGAAGFAALEAGAREAVLRGVERSHPEAFEALVRHTYEGYYSDPGIVARLGLDPTPPHPRGHRVEAGDLGSLERVAARGPLYRRTE